MSWNYRLVKYHNGGYGVHEVYYNDRGIPTSMTERPVTFAFDTASDVIDSLKLAIKDIQTKGVFIPLKGWLNEKETKETKETLS